MHEIIEQIRIELRGSWRFRRSALVVAWLVSLIGWVAVLMMPDIYQARAQVFVDAQSRLAEVMSDVGVAPGVGSQVFVVRQAMLAQPQLEKVARQTDLALRARTPEDMEQLLASLKERVSVSTGRTREAQNLYTISFEDRDRQMAIAVVQRLLSTFVDDVLDLKEQGADDVEGYLDEQLAHYSNLLSTAENNLAEFKKRHVGLLPEESGGIFERLQLEMTNLSQLELQLETEIDRRDELRRQLQTEDPFAEAPPQPGTAGTTTSTNPTQAAIDELERTRGQLLLRYTERHPDVVAANEQLAQLYDKLEQERALRASSGGGVEGVANSTNPVYQSVQIALNETSVRIAALRSQRDQQARLVARLRDQVDTIPEIEAEFAQLTRNYDQYRSLYGEIMLKKERERMGNVGEERDVVSFNIIDPPSAPLEPVAPPRGLFLLIVLIGALGAGGGVAFLLHQLNPVFHDARTLQRVTDRPVLGTVSLVWLDLQRKQRRGAIASFAMACLGLVAVFGITLAFNDVGVEALRNLTEGLTSKGLSGQ